MEDDDNGGQPKLMATSRILPVVFCVMSAVVVVFLAVAHEQTPRGTLRLAVVSPRPATADGASIIKLQLSSIPPRDLTRIQVNVELPEDSPLARLQSDRLQEDGTRLIQVRTGVVPGVIPIMASGSHFVTDMAMVRTRISVSDRFEDGTPDFLRLDSESDRARFLRWFALLAESQAVRPPDGLPREVVDCAALVRLAYREALRRHDHTWEMRDAVAPVSGIGDVSKYNYPYTPLGAALFRVKPGAFAQDDLRSGAFLEFADAETLMRRNTHFISRDVARARPGDLLFYYQPSQKMPYHVMIIVGDSLLDASPSAANPAPAGAIGGEIAPLTERAVGRAMERSQWVVYHTGPSSRSRGEMRRVTIDDLFRHPEPRWHPRVANPNFLGVYRWNILRR